tara:strand:- start:155 stop:475 length:321 start_codon:yes stop_codon:yes gene_type:complete
MGIFKDKCIEYIDSESKRRIGFICGLYIFLLILGVLYYIYNIIYVLSKSDEDKDERLELVSIPLSIYEIIVGLISIWFMYYMCSICRGFIGFLIIASIGLIHGMFY